MSDREDGPGLIGRWSRLKRARLAAPVLPPAPVEPSVEPEPPVEIPPPAESIPLEDITAWLGKRVPDGWREAALRRVWSADGAIREFVGPADYAWDWNTPGGAPGWGPIQATDDLVRALARAIGEELPPKPETPPEPAELQVVSEATEPWIEIDTATEPAAKVEPPSVPLARRGGRAMPV